MTGRPFDAVLVIAFGGPEGPADIRPFLANVLRGRRVPAERVEAVAKHYELFGGVSPLTAITRRQVDGLKARLDAEGVDVPVYLGMRNWHPLLPDALRTMARILGFKSLACQESALHGLGHWQRDHDRQVSAVIDGFLVANPDIDTRLVSYANSARCGCVL